MKRISVLLSLAFLCGLAALSAGQQGGFGGGLGGAQAGFGGMQQGNQGQLQRDTDYSAQAIDRAIATYLPGEEIKSILTPGEYVEWTLKLKAGQVVIADARSDAFDPALEIVDDKNKVLASNDDRYPGDQRPLLLWRCERDGDYALHARCFHDKSGGQIFVRFKTYDSVDLSSGDKVEKEVAGGVPVLLRIPMKAGQNKEVRFDTGTENKYMGLIYNEWISPSGLPDLVFPTLPIQPAVYSVMAPVDGVYYEMQTPYGAEHGKIRVWTRDIVPSKLTRDGATFTAKAPTNVATIWELPVKAGELLEASAAELSIYSSLMVANKPDISKYDLSKPETNPFFPHADRHTPEDEPAFDQLSARARDGRLIVFRARRDTTLWLASNAAGPGDRLFTLVVKPAASDFGEGKSNVGKLRIADTDYWAFDAKAGDVMNLSSTANPFSELIIVRDPDLGELRHYEAGLDQSTDNWRMIVQKPGRYLVAVACSGNGGGGEYSLSRKVFHAKDFSMSAPAKGEIFNDQVQIWKFTAQPSKPILIHWSSTKWSYGIAIYNEKGQRTDFQRQGIDDHNAFGLIKVTEPQTFVIVLTGGVEKSSYSIELGDIPGFKGDK